MGDLSNEPTMEEILSSIKKIIAEDGEKSLSVARPRRTAQRDPAYDELGSAVAMMAADPRRDEDDVLELTNMADNEISDTVAQSVPVPQAQPQPTVAVATPTPAPVEIVSPTTVAASRSALESLSSLVIKPEITGTDTLEGMVREMIRPMLKDWLDARLPDLVEAMVAREIARISGR